MDTIVAKKYLHIQDEKLAGGTIIPGMLVQRTSTDGVIAHNVAGGSVNKLFALEDDKQGNGITDNYSSGNLVQLWHPVPGEVVYAIATVSGGAIAIGDFVESDGTGRLRKQEGPQSSVAKDEFGSSIVGVAVEAAASGVAVRFKVEIL
jgi:hypothetical protein